MAYYVPSITTMGVLTGVPALRHVVPVPRYAVRVRVYRAGEWVDITNRVASGVIRESNDQSVATLELRLLNGREYPSLAPRRKDSPLNQVNGQYVPLLWIGRLIAVDAAFSEDGSEPDEWWPVFLGELEDEIDTESGPDGTYVRVFCRDMATRLQRAYIAGPWTFENMYASEMIQAILDHAYSEDLIPEPVQLRLIGPDDFWVERYDDIEYTDLWSALQRFCQQRGTDLRYRLNEATGQIELTYWLPDRTMVPGWIIDASQVRREELRISGTDILNRVTVRYRDAQTGQRAEVTVQDADSIAMYGLRHGLIEESDTDLIPDEATAQKLAQSIVEDLKDVPALTRLTVPFDPRIQLFDKLRVANPSVRDEPEDYAIEGRELSFSATDWSMTLIGGGRVVVKRQAWLERLATEGVRQPFTPRDTVTARGMSKPTGVAVTSISGGIAVRFDPPVGEEYMRWWESEVHISTQANFTPGPATKVASGRYTYFELTQGLQPNTTYYVRIIHVDMSLNKSEPSDVASGQIAPITEGIIDPSLFAIVPTSDPAPSSGSLEDLWDMNPNTGVTFPSAPITITFRYPVYQGSDLVDLHLGAAAQGYVQMRQRDTGQLVDVLGSPASPVQFSQGWNRVPFTGGKLYFGREYRLVLLDNVRVNELRFERVTVADKILAGRLRLTGNMAIEGPDGGIILDHKNLSVLDGLSERITIGDVGGRMWRGKPLPAGEIGFYGDRHTGLYLEGYSSLISVGQAVDEDEISAPEGAKIILTPASVLVTVPNVTSPVSHNLGYIRTSPTKVRIKSKLSSGAVEHLLIDTPTMLPHNPDNYPNPDAGLVLPEQGGLSSVLFKAEVGVAIDTDPYAQPWANSGSVWAVFTDVFDATGDPVFDQNWQELFYANEEQDGIGYHTRVVEVPLNGSGPWAVKLQFQSRWGEDGATSGFVEWAKLIDVSRNYDSAGQEIGPSDPSGMAVNYFVIQG